MQQNITLPSSLLTDSSAEPLKILLKPYKGITHTPADVGQGDVACFVFIELQKCFQKQGFVAEGLMGNVIWGFEQCGFDPRAVAAGLQALRKLGYLIYTDPRGTEIHELSFDPKTLIWIRYTSKMLNLFVRELAVTSL